MKLTILVRKIRTINVARPYTRRTLVKRQLNIQTTSDHEFDQLYHEIFRHASEIHWTPTEVASTAIKWLEVSELSHILDIGAGVGKFCAVGELASNARFTGIELREDLTEEAERVANVLQLYRTRYINDDVKTIDFSAFTGFYYYNPFCEQIAIADKIDDSISYDPDGYTANETYVSEQFDQLPIGTRVVTYCSQAFPMSDKYELVDLNFDGLLALWIKVKD